MSQLQGIDDIKIIFACGDCPYATTDRSDIDAHLVTVHEKSDLLEYNQPSDNPVLATNQPTTLEYITPGSIVLAPINTQVTFIVQWVSQFDIVLKW